MPDVIRYTPAQMATEVNQLVQNYNDALNVFDRIEDSIEYSKESAQYESDLVAARAEIAEDNEYFEDISEAIQSKTGQAEPYDKSEMADAISEEWVQPTLIQKQITANKTYYAEEDGVDGYSEVDVDVPVPIIHLTSITACNTPDTEMNMAGIKGLTSITFSNNPNLERIINLDASGVSSLNTCFTHNNHLVLLDWTPPLHLTYMGRAFQNCNAIIEIDFTGTTFSASNWGSAFYCCYALVTIYGELDFTSCTIISDTFYRCDALENVSFKANTIPISLSFSNSPLLSNASIISIANGLSESASSQTLTLHADVKNKLSTIFGIVALDDTQTYYVFTADSGGTVTLSEFITNTKGWSIA